MLTHLECTRSGESFPADRPQSVCPKDAAIFYARCDLAPIKRMFSSASSDAGTTGVAALKMSISALPVRPADEEENRVLGE